jgi:hypothetical protein
MKSLQQTSQLFKNLPENKLSLLKVVAFLHPRNLPLQVNYTVIKFKYTKKDQKKILF